MGNIKRLPKFTVSNAAVFGDKLQGAELSFIVAEVLFDLYPDKNRILMSIPTDLREVLPWIPPNLPGNFTGSLVVQLFRESDLQQH